MLVKSQVKYIQSLGHKKFRDVDGVFVAEGPKIVNELLAAEQMELVQCFGTATWLVQMNPFFIGREKLFTEVGENELAKISFHTTPNQVLAVFRKPQLPTRDNGIILMLDTVQDPGNLGTIVRTADWFGVDQIICSEQTADIFNPKTVQSAMGSLIRVAVLYTDLGEYIASHPDIPVYAASLDGEDLKEKLALRSALLLMGNESKGIRSSLEALAHKKVRIAGRGRAESLNVAVATGILLSQIEMIS